MQNYFYIIVASCAAGLIGLVFNIHELLKENNELLSELLELLSENTEDAN